ncbi:MAG TPA: cupin domain-containing protein [Candidatus Cybelea sp.]|nr:cupin domain-containing protein [Candidatus Cybelea sp.]
MKRSLLCLLLAPMMLLAGQETAPEGFEHWTSTSLKDLSLLLSEQAAADPHHFAVKQLADFPNESFLFVRRQSDGAVEWHENQIDIFLVESGSATLLIGGTYLNGETVGPHEKRNGTIQGGTRVKLSPGDVVRIPPRVPHQVLLDGAQEFTYFVVKGKGY